MLSAADSPPRLHGRAEAQDETFAEAILRHEPAVRRLVHRLLGWPRSSTDADDIVQDVLLQAWRHRRHFRGDAAWQTWLVRIGINTTRSHQRRQSLRRRFFGAGEDECGAEAPTADTPISGEPLDARIAAVRSAMARLRHADREILVLRYLEQMPIESLAADLAVTRNALDARLSRARRRLRELLPGDVDV